MASRETEERLELKGLLARLEQPALEGWLGPKDLVETKERLVRQEKEDRRAIVDSLVCRVFQDLLVLLGMLEPLDLLDPVELRDHQAQLDLLEKMDLMDRQAPLDLLDHVAGLEKVVLLVLRVILAPLALRVLLALASTCLLSLA